MYTREELVDRMMIRMKGLTVEELEELLCYSTGLCYRRKQLPQPDQEEDSDQ